MAKIVRNVQVNVCTHLTEGLTNDVASMMANILEIEGVAECISDGRSLWVKALQGCDTKEIGDKIKMAIQMGEGVAG